MDDGEATFAVDFPPATLDQWRALVDKALKGVPFEKKLVTRLYEGIAVQPLYTSNDWAASRDPSSFPGVAPFTRGGHASGAGPEGWEVLTEHNPPDGKQANKAILTDLMRGATAIDLHFDRPDKPGIVIDTLDDLDLVLKDVIPDLVPLSLDAGHDALAAAAMLAAFWRRRSVSPAAARGSFDVDPIGALAATGNLPESLDHALSRMAELAQWTSARYPNVTAIEVDSSAYFEAGATEAQDLAAAMSTGVAYLKALTGGGMDIDAALAQITFTMAVGCDQFLSIAKLRAARRLWARVAEACGATESACTMKLRARTARRIMSRRDPWVNMLRTTVAGFAAGAGGADSVTVTPFDAALGISDDFARRIARNTQILLKEESYVSRVTDPAGGSWYVETLTEQLARTAWEAFQSIEGRGGIAAALLDGSLSAEIASSWAQRRKNIARRKDPLTGASEFPNILETPVERDVAKPRPRPGRLEMGAPLGSIDEAVKAIEAGRSISAVSFGLASGTPVQIAPLPKHSVHEDFEALRDAADRHKARVGEWPRIFLVNMGPVAQHTARSTFAKNFFEAGGIQALGNDGFIEPKAAAEAFRKSGASIAVLCAVDALYETDTAAFAAALKEAGVAHLFQAGNPGAHKEDYERAGVDEFIFIGVDVISVLTSTLARLGVHPDVVTVLGGVHGTFMYNQVLFEAPWIDAVVRGEGEAVLVNIARAVDQGEWPGSRGQVAGIAYIEGAKVLATPAEPPIRDVDSITPDWGILDWEKYVYVPLGVRVATPNMARGCPFTCSFCSQWKFWRDYRVRKPKLVVDEIETLVRDHKVGFFILADEEPTINQKAFVAFCEELIARDLPVLWGINTRVTDVLRDEALLPLYRKAGLVHISLGTEAAAQLKLDLFNKETTVAHNKKAIQLLQQNGIVAEAQFIVGLENETRETLEQTYEMVRDWNPDMANWSMFTPWPFSDLYRELGDKVEVFDFEKYNFVTPIMKPEAMDRGELLDGVMSNYRRFYMNKALFGYPWTRDPLRRRYLLGCLKAFLKSAFERKFYDLGRAGYWGPQSKKKVDFHFDESRQLQRSPENEATAAWKSAPKRKQEASPTAAAAAAMRACGGGTEQMEDQAHIES